MARAKAQKCHGGSGYTSRNVKEGELQIEKLNGRDKGANQTKGGWGETVGKVNKDKQSEGCVEARQGP